MKTKNKKTGIDQITAVLKDAGYKILRQTQKPGAHVVHVSPANLGVDAEKGTGNFRALEALQAKGLQADCNVFAALPKDVLIVTVAQPLPEAKPKTSSPKPKA